MGPKQIWSHPRPWTRCNGCGCGVASLDASPHPQRLRLRRIALSHLARRGEERFHLVVPTLQPPYQLAAQLDKLARVPVS